MELPTGIYRRCGSTGLIAIGLLLIGSLAFLHAVANRGGLSMDCSRFLAEKPNGRWVKLSGCVVTRILSVTKTSSGGSPTEVFVPIRAEGAKADREIRLLLVSNHPDDLEFVKRANEQSSTRSGRGMFRSSYGNELEQTREIEGRILRGLDLPDRDRIKLTKTFPTLAQDFVMIETKPRPGFTLPLVCLVLACLAGGYRLFVLFRHRLFSRLSFPRGVMAAAK